ncbi:MAG: F0F1 ATP synthase subunit A [Clostridiaceae bacterium]
MEIGAHEVFTFHLGKFEMVITSSIVTQWIVMAVIMILILVLTRNIQKIPGKSQSAIEIIIETIKGQIFSNMGEKYKNFLPYIGTLFIFLFFLNMTGLIGVEPSTKDVSVTAGLAVISFLVIQFTSIKKGGVGGYLKGYLHPFALMLPLNIIERFTVPFSLALRLFVNMLVGAIVLELAYHTVGLIVPIPLHAFFDLFDGSIQMYVFVMLTMINIRMTVEHSDTHH